MINIILWEMGNLKWPNPYNLHVYVKWRWAHSHYKDHVAPSCMLAFQRQCNLRQKLVFQCPQSTQLKSNSFMLSFISSDLCLKASGSQKEFKITKGNASQSTTNHLTGVLEQNFIATDINHLLITDPICLWIICGYRPHNLEPHRGKSNPNISLIASRKNALKWLTFPKVMRPWDGFFCFKIAFLLTQSIWFLLPPDHDHKDISNPCEKCDSVSPFQLYVIKNRWSFGGWGGGGKGSSRDLIHAVPSYDMTRFVIETFSLLLSLFYLTNHLMLIRDREHISVYHV